MLSAFSAFSFLALPFLPASSLALTCGIVHAGKG